jgi:hypothetical protein
MIFSIGIRLGNWPGKFVAGTRQDYDLVLPVSANVEECLFQFRVGLAPPFQGAAFGVKRNLKNAAVAPERDGFIFILIIGKMAP